MITKINTTTPIKHNYNNYKHISFKSGNTISDDISINSREINSDVQSRNGDINIAHSPIETKSMPESTVLEQSQKRVDMGIEESGEIFYNHGFDEIPIEHDATYLPSQRYKSSSIFRDEELFDEETDLLESQKYLQYSEDDVPLRDDLWMHNSKSVAQYNQYYTEYPETSYENEMQFYPAIHSPWSYLSESFFDKTKLKSFMSLASLEIEKISDDYTLPNKIFNKCRVLRHGKNRRDLNLCKLALYLFNNSKEWGEVEEQIMDAVKLPIYGKVYGAISYVKYNIAKAGIIREMPNQKILERLKNVSLIDVYRLRGLVK